MATLREKWIAALRSGEYVQGTGARRKDGKHCCIGVLCDLADPGEWIDRGYDHMSWDAFNMYSPYEGPRLSDLMSMNDLRGCTFTEIADYIEAHPEIDPVWPPEGE